jgi:hypothetical protein
LIFIFDGTDPRILNSATVPSVPFVSFLAVYRGKTSSPFWQHFNGKARINLKRAPPYQRVHLSRFLTTTRADQYI